MILTPVQSVLCLVSAYIVGLILGLILGRILNNKEIPK